jgi:hypothetical protein
MEMSTPQRVDFSDADTRRKRLDEVGWGIFLIMIGVIWLVPSVPQGTWLIGTGVLLLLLNAVRYRSGAGWSGFSTTLGAIALVAGLGELTGTRLPLFALCLVAIGVSLVLKPLISAKA